MAGWLEDYKAFDLAAGLADLSAWGKLSFTGPDRRKFLHGLLTNDVLGLPAWRGLEACLLTAKGRLQAHLELYDCGDELLALCRPECAGNLRDGLSKLVALSSTRLAQAPLGLFYLAGPAARRALEAAAGPLPELAGAQVHRASFGGEPLLVIAHARLRPGGLLLLPPARLGPDLARALEAAGARPAGAEALEALRVEAGVPAFGRDMDQTTMPHEARLERALSFTKGCYLGQETVSRIHHMGHVNRRLAALALESPEPPAAGALVRSAGGEAGTVTSAVFSPSRGKALALAMVKVSEGRAGARLEVESGGRRAAAEVVDLWG